MVEVFPKLAGYSNPHIRSYRIRLLNRWVGGMVADFPTLAGDSNAHKWQ